VDTDAPMIKLANLIIQQAVRDGASDVHIEPGEDDVKVRFCSALPNAPRVGHSFGAEVVRAAALVDTAAE